MKKIILLNGGSRTRRAFALGVTHTTLECYASKKILLHINKQLDLLFVHENKYVDFTDSYVFTRLRATDAHFCGILYEHLSATGIFASDAINLSYKASEEKIAQMGRLARARVPIPETIIAREESYELNKKYILEHITFPLVYKTDGSQGKAVFKINTQEELDEKIAQKNPRELFLLQELIPNTFDTRTLVAYGKVLGSIKRTAQNGNFLNNVAQGGLVEPYELTTEEKTLALRAVVVNKIDFGGVDIIHTNNGPKILEVNKSPQIKGFEKIHGENVVFKSIAENIEAQMYKDEGKSSTAN